VLDKSGHYELSDKLFSIAQRKAPPSLRRTPNPPGVISDQELPDTQADAFARKYPLNNQNTNLQLFNNPTIRQIAKSSDPFVDALMKDAPPELIKEIYSFGIEKLESKEGLQSFLGLATGKFGNQFSNLINKIKSKFTARPMSGTPNKANKVLSMASNPSFEVFLQMTNKLSPSAKIGLRSLMQSSGKNLQNISQSLHNFAGSPQAQLVEPAIEIAFNEFGKYLENPQAYKSQFVSQEQNTINQMNARINEILADNKIQDKKTYFMKQYGSYLKTLGTMEQNQLLSKFPAMGFNQFQNIGQNIGQK
jgi:hypothetical protein